jgi:DNA primase
MMIPEDIIVRIRESVDLVELIRESVTGLKKAGRNYQARCPFHQERSPSFVVNPALSIFKCFGCGVGGDAFKFVMLLEHLSYPEAIRKLAARVQIEIPEETQAVDSPDALERERFYKLMEDAASFYERYLWQSKEAE